MLNSVLRMFVSAIAVFSLATNAVAAQSGGPKGTGAYVVVVYPDRHNGPALTADEAAFIMTMNTSCATQIAAQVPSPVGGMIRGGVHYGLPYLFAAAIGLLPIPGMRSLSTVMKYAAEPATVGAAGGAVNSGETRRYADIASQNGCMRDFIKFANEHPTAAHDEHFLEGVFAEPWYAGDARTPTLGTVPMS
jgi:hypothetical protein